MGDVSNYGTSEDYENSKGLAEVLTKRLQTVRVCGDKKGCFTKGYYKFTNGSQWNDSLDNGKHRYKLITIDGMSMAFHWYSRDCNRLDKNLEICGIVFVDIDGPRGGTATWGKDLYRFMLTKDRIIPDGDPRHAGDSFNKSECPKQGTQCAAWVIYNENRDYLKCKDLEWDKKSRCKEEKFNNLPK
ncbi:hypothetical protein IKU74_06870 [bacterium]|nr:hypothetical protein [bacterium]